MIRYKCKCFFKNYYPSIIWIIILLFLSMHISLFMDESFTMSLIHHSYSAIIKIDELDVHPPLYYILLKLFLSITTFWTKSLPVQIIASRLFSFICFLLFIIVLIKILDLYNLKYNKNLLFIFISILPADMQGFPTYIRMYILSTLFISLEFLNIMSYIRMHHNKYLYLATLFAICSLYTHDFAAVIAGLLLLIAFINALIKRNNAINWFCSGIIFALSYLPWLKVSYKQIFKMPKHYWITSSHDISCSLKVLFIIIILGLPILLLQKYINKHVKYMYIYISQICVVFLILELIYMIHKPIFTLRYAYPLYTMYAAIAFGIISQLHYSNLLKKCKLFNIKYSYLLIIIFVLLGIKYIHGAYKGQLVYHQQSSEISRYFNNNHKIIHVNTSKFNTQSIEQLNTYAQYNNKYLTKKENAKIFNNKQLQQGTNKKLMKKIWDTNKFNEK